MKFVYKNLKKYHFEISIALSFTLPPIGLMCLVFIGWYSLHRVWKEARFIHFTPGLFLLGCLFLSTIGSSFYMKDYSYFLVTVLILAYMGIYIKMTTDGVQRSFTSFKWLTIGGGFYFYCLYPFQQILMTHPIASLLMGTSLIGYPQIQEYERLMGAAYNPNFSVALLLFGLSLLLAEILKCIRKHQLIFLGMLIACVALFLHAILLTGSRGGFCVSIIIVILFVFRWNKLFAVLLINILALHHELIVAFMPRYNELIKSADLRQEIWRNSFNLWQNHSLFGISPIGFYQEYFYHYHEKVPHAHNVIISMFAEYGALGGIAFLIVMFINGYKVLWLYLSKKTDKKYLDVFLLSLPAIFLTGIVDHVLYSPQVAFIAIILLASWEKYTARLYLINPSIWIFTRKWMWWNTWKASKTPKN
ncbi:O-antigen ligase family protein [Fictibacillus nanhaiensis]|uniref:O-antigen ligase family protein n=1 Tax=Fictibacillus nanhaiensis TaxID=742169 RepID=A0ABS2ZNJ7_9BACL|nr:O-antigen ligase family protein [Fictibacillus nanhaiensis]